MNIKFDITVRNEINDLVWTHGIFTPNVSKEFVSELDSVISSLRFNNSDGMLDSCSSITEIQGDTPIASWGCKFFQSYLTDNKQD